jgi:hypothetical protein
MVVAAQRAAQPLHPPASDALECSGLYRVDEVLGDR